MAFFNDLWTGKIRLWIAFWCVYFCNGHFIAFLAIKLVPALSPLIIILYTLLSALIVTASANNYCGKPVYATSAKLIAYFSWLLSIIIPLTATQN